MSTVITSPPTFGTVTSSDPDPTPPAGKTQEEVLEYSSVFWERCNELRPRPRPVLR